MCTCGHIPLAKLACMHGSERSYLLLSVTHKGDPQSSGCDRVWGESLTCLFCLKYKGPGRSGGHVQGFLSKGKRHKAKLGCEGLDWGDGSL